MGRVTETEGYTLVEMLIVLAIAGLIGGAILGVYRVSQNAYIRASSLEAAQLGARAGLDRMANELRLLGSYWVGAAGAGNAITAASPTSITFMANVNDLYMSNATALEATVSSNTGSSVTLTNISASDTADAFKVYSSNPALNNDYIYIANGGRREVRQIASINGSTLTLASAPNPPYPAGSLVRDVKTITYALNAGTLTRSQGGSGVDPIVDNVTGLTFTYFDTAGGALAATPPNTGLIREIQVDITVQGPDGSSRRMTTRVKPRSLP